MRTYNYKDEFVTYKQSLELKELNFNIPVTRFWENIDIIDEALNYDCFNNWNDEVDCISCPLFQQVIDWADTNYGLLGYITKYNDNTYDWVIINPNITSPIDHGDGPFTTRQEAKHALISILIETIKSLNK